MRDSRFKLLDKRAFFWKTRAAIGIVTLSIGWLIIAICSNSLLGDNELTVDGIIEGSNRLVGFPSEHHYFLLWQGYCIIILALAGVVLYRTAVRESRVKHSVHE